MIKETLTYKDFNGEERSDDFYFHLNALEWLRMDKKYGGIREYIRKAVKDGDEYAILNMLEDLVKSSYGEKSMDGIRFVKNDDLVEKFTQTEAYSNMLIGFFTDTQKGIDFFNRLVPDEIKADDTAE